MVNSRRLQRVSSHLLSSAALEVFKCQQPAAKHVTVYIACDSEGGTAMAEYWARNLGWDNPRHQEYRELMTRDCNACIEGCYRGGATQVIVSDDGMGGVLTVPELWDPRARWVRGPEYGGPTPLLQGADSSFLGVMLIGFHSMQGTPGGVLAHTYSSAVRRATTANGDAFGELLEYAVAAGHDYNLPVLLVHGDNAVCAEARELLGDGVHTVAVKEGFQEQRALMVAPAKAREMLTDGAREAVATAVAGGAVVAPLRMRGPIRLTLELVGASATEAAEFALKRKGAWAEVGAVWPMTQRAGTSFFDGTLLEVPRQMKML